MKIAIGADHAGFAYKEQIKNYLLSKNYEVTDKGTYSEERADYPDFAHPLAVDVEEGTVDFGILICGSGNGVNITANRHKGVRSALAWLPEVAVLARQHNDANVIAIPARFVSPEVAIQIVDVFLAAQFEGGRHASRVQKINIH